MPPSCICNISRIKSNQYRYYHDFLYIIIMHSRACTYNIGEALHTHDIVAMDKSHVCSLRLLGCFVLISAILSLSDPIPRQLAPPTRTINLLFGQGAWRLQNHQSQDQCPTLGLIFACEQQKYMYIHNQVRLLEFVNLTGSCFQ